MYIKINNKKLEVDELLSFGERFTGLKFNLKKLDYAVKYPKRKWFNTNFICQRLDIVFTDKNEKILYMYEDFGTERNIWPRHGAYNVYLLPLNSIKYLSIGQVLKSYK